MLSELQSRYGRVDKALDGLLASITAHNPSITAADELVIADEEVNDALEELAVHHANYARILSLRATAAALDEQIKSTMRSLVDTRKTLKAINLPRSSSTTSASTPIMPLSQATAEERPVRVNELLAYAKFISKTTVPPTRREPAPVADTTSAAPTTEREAEASSAGGLQVAIKNEPQTPDPNILTMGAGASTAPTPSATGGAGTGETKQEQSETMQRALPPEIRGQFIPWPTQEQMKMGALGTVQAIVERGEDPAEVTAAPGADTAQEVAEKSNQKEEDVVEGFGTRGNIGGHPARPREEDEFDPDEM